MKKTLVALSIFTSTLSFAETVSVTLNIRNEAPMFGVSYSLLESDIASIFNSKGHKLVSDNDNPTAKIIINLNGGQYRGFDNGRTTVGTYSGVIYSIRKYNVVQNKGKNKSLELINSLQPCSALATDDKAFVIKDSVLSCINNYLQDYF